VLPLLERERGMELLVTSIKRERKREGRARTIQA
jgi:hypothetical protein